MNTMAVVEKLVETGVLCAYTINEFNPDAEFLILTTDISEIAEYVKTLPYVRYISQNEDTGSFCVWFNMGYDGLVAYNAISSLLFSEYGKTVSASAAYYIRKALHNHPKKNDWLNKLDIIELSNGNLELK